MTPANKQSGFTIVELLIVIVVIGILAAISITAFNGVTNRANDSAVQNDLKNIAKQLEVYKINNGVYPVGDTQLGLLDIKVTKPAYGSGILSDTYNVLYCRVALDGPDKFAIIASSKSGSVFTYRSETGTTVQASSWVSSISSNVNCQAAGINQTTASDRDFFYINSAWRPYVN